MSLVFSNRTSANESGLGCAVSPDGNFIAVASSAAGAAIVIRAWSSAGIGAAVATDTSPAGTFGFNVAWHPSGSYVALAHSGSPFVTVFSWDGSSLSAVSNPATLPPSQANTVDFSPDGNYLIAGGSATWMKCWNWSAGWGSFINDAPTLAGAPQRALFNPSGSHVVAAHNTSPFISAWPFTGSGFGAKMSNPGTLPASGGLDCAWSDDGAWVGVVHSASPYVTVYAWSSGFGSKASDPATLPGTGSEGISFSPSTTHIIVGANATVDGSNRQVLAWEWSSGFGSLVAHPDLQPSAATRGITTTPAGNVIVVTDGSGGTASLVGYIVGGMHVGYVAMGA